MTVIWAVLLLVLAAAPSAAALLENPGHGRLYSGIGVISGWKCEAEGDLTVRFNGGEPHETAARDEHPGWGPNAANGAVRADPGQRPATQMAAGEAQAGQGPAEARAGKPETLLSAQRTYGGGRDMIRRWESRVGAQMWLDDNPETEGEPYLLRAILDDNGKTTREVWVIRTQAGYLTSE